MTKHTALPVGLGIGILIGAGLMFALGRNSSPVKLADEERTGSKPDGAGQGEQVVLYKLPDIPESAIRTAPIRQGSVAEIIRVNGRVVPDPNRIARVSPLVAGRMLHLLAGVGQKVRAGETLAIIESTEAGRAYASYQQSQSRLTVAESELQSVKRLARAGVFAQKPVDEVKRERAQVASELATMRVAYAHEAGVAESETKTTQASLARAQSVRDLARAELGRRKSLVEAGVFQYKPLEEARREVAEARASVIATEANLEAAENQSRRLDRLRELGTASQREVEVAHAAQSEFRASLERARARLDIAKQSMSREQKIFDQKIYATRETESAEGDLIKADRDVQEKQAALDQAVQRRELARSPDKNTAVKEMENRLAALDALLNRETSVARQDLLAELALKEKASAVAQARIELQATANAVRLFNARPNGAGRVGIPLLSPITGVVSERPAQIGQTVDPGMVLFTVLDASSVWVEMDLYEKDLPKVQVGQTASLLIAERPAWSRSARIVRIGSTVDPATRVAHAIAAVTASTDLKPGMFVTAEIGISAGRAGLIVPREAVVDEPTGAAVYIKWPDDQGWERHPVQVLETNAKHALIKGPAADEQVATTGVALVQAAVRSQRAGGGGTATAHTHEH